MYFFKYIILYYIILYYIILYYIFLHQTVNLVTSKSYLVFSFCGEQKLISIKWISILNENYIYI